MLQIICDKCGKDISKSEKIGYLVWNFKEHLEGNQLQENIFEKNHYCQECMEKIKTFITEEGKKELEEEKKFPKEKIKKRIDIGKIMALKKAGWKNKEIAMEMHMEPQAVAGAIYNYKKKKIVEETVRE